MRTLVGILFCVVALSLCGCSREPAPKALSLRDVQAQIDKVPNDPNIPPQAKGAILASLQHEKELAQKQAAVAK